MPNYDSSLTNLTDLILQILSESSGNLIEDINLNSNLTTELNLTREDCYRLIKSIEKAYNTQIVSPNPDLSPISLTPLLNPDELDEIETVTDLIDAVSNEIELG